MRASSAQNLLSRGKIMRWPTRWFVLLAVSFMAPGTLVYAQSDKPADDRTKPASKAATEEEVEQLRREVADLKATIQQLVQINHQQADGGGHLVQASGAPLSSASAPEPTAADIEVLQKEIDVLQKKASDAPAATSGWNGEHFFLKSSDGNFTLMPVGYLNAQYQFNHGDGAPPDTFAIRRARFGVQGSYGKQLDYAFLFDTANTASNAIAVRDAYIDFKPWKIAQFQAGQFKVPFSQEVGTGDTSVEFIERSPTAVLYPDAAGTFRAPGVVAHGNIGDGLIQYWAGVFNGKGLVATNTTDEPEVVARMRIYPFRHSDGMFKGLAIGGSINHSRSRGLSNELSFSGVMNDSLYTFFPQFRINGGIERYNGHFQWLYGRMGIRGEYTQGLWKRQNVGAEQLGGIGFVSLPGITGKGAYVQGTYLLTGETEPENAIPRVKHPVIGPNSPGETGGPGWGAWSVKFRYSWLEGRAPGFNCPPSICPITPAIFPLQSDQTRQYSMGVNWYLNYWVLLKFDFNVDQLKNPSVQGVTPRNYFVALQGVQFRF
jgi:phosphate-selective porin